MRLDHLLSKEKKPWRHGVRKKLTEMVRIEWLFNFERTDLSSMKKETSSLDL